jgi:CzcA family heavy metal efflux pump
MWIVRFALRYRYTIGVFAILIMLFGIMSARKMSTDILPTVEAPEITLVWTYNGLNAKEMAAKITSFSEIATLNNVDDLVEVRSETSNGVGLVKLVFQPYVNIEMAMAQVTSVSQTILRRMPQGTTPPLIVQTSPSSVPIIQLVISSDTMTDGQLFDYARLALRAQIQSIPGVRMSLPYGGAARQVMIDLVPEALNSFGLSAADVNRAIGTQNLTLPSGMLRDGGRELPVAINASPESVDAFLDLPIREVDGRVVFLRDVANARDGETISTNVARLNGQNAVMVTILKLGKASTVDIVNGILARLPDIRASAPEGIRVEPIFDQSVFVNAAVGSVLHEIVLVGSLVALVVLLFLGSWRSTLIVLCSIPLALLCSILGLYLVGATFNLMTLGGLALVIGILVDNALVEIENTKRHIALGKPVQEAILDSAREVAFPEFVSTTSICIVFMPIFLLTGTAAFVFKPLALAVIFAMIASYVLSRTLVPTLASMMMPSEVEAEKKPPGLFRRFHHRMENGIDRLAAIQGSILRLFLRRGIIVVALIAIVLTIGGGSASRLGREFFPVTDAGLMSLFLRAPAGTRLEETGRTFADIHREIRKIIPKEELLFVTENVGQPSAVNQAWVPSTAVGSYDGEILVQLADGHRPTAEYMAKVRSMLAEKFPDVKAFFRPADATSQTLASGSPTTFEIRYIGRDIPGNLKLANELIEKFRKVPGAVDVTLREVLGLPEFYLQIDRTRAAQLGITQQDAVNSLLSFLGSGGTVSSSFWADPVNGSSYDVQIIAPPKVISSPEQLLNLPITRSGGGERVLLGAFAELGERKSPASISRTTLQPTYTVLGNIQGRDLGAVTSDLEKIIASQRPHLKPNNRIELAGQAALMKSAYSELISGLGLAAVLVFLVMVVNFQSWSMPFIAISGLPIAISGAAFGLWVTGTPLSVPALMGVIMVVGVSTANSVLVTSFARDRWAEGVDGVSAAMEAATTRLRPVMMTALAMILGVVPMAIGHGEGGEQNAPLGRAVIGGLLFGTIASLFLVPTVFAWMKGRKTARPVSVKESTQDTEIPANHEPELS